MGYDIVKNTALKIKLRNISGSIVHHVAILKRVMDARGIPVEMVKGYCIIENTKEACEHYWVRSREGLDFDIGFAVACMRTPELMALIPVLLETLPPGLIRSDQEATEILTENSRLFQLHQEDPKAFWREAPKDVAGFRAMSL